MHFRRISRLRWLRFLSRIAVLVGLLLFLWGVYRYLFIIRRVECRANQDQTCPEPVLAELNRLRTESLIFTDTAVVQQKILGSSVRFDSIEFASVLPGALKVELTTATPLAVVYEQPTNDSYILLDNQRLASLDEATTSGLPLIVAEQDMITKINYPVHDPVLLGASNLAQELQQSYQVFTQIRIASQSAFTKINNQTELRLDPLKDAREQVILVDLLLQQNLETIPSLIDVRFDKPVVQF